MVSSGFSILALRSTDLKLTVHILPFWVECRTWLLPSFHQDDMLMWTASLSLV